MSRFFVQCRRCVKPCYPNETTIAIVTPDYYGSKAIRIVLCADCQAEICKNMEKLVLTKPKA